MGLKALLKSIEEVPEAVRDFYTKTDEGFVLDVDDGQFKARINEFRENNIALRKQVDAVGGAEHELKALRDKVKNYQNIDPAKAREAIQRLEELEEKNLLDAGELDKVVSQRTERMRADFEAKLAESEGLGNKFRSLYTDNVVDNSLQRAISEVAPPRPGAMQDILARGRSLWKVDDDGQLMPVDQNGQVRYGKDGQKPVTPKEWAESLISDAPYLFEPSNGGGAGGGGGGGNGATRIQMDDQQSINNNLEAIAAGKVEVVSQ